MRLGKFSKVPADKKRYTVDYNDWLDTGETLSTVVLTVTPTTLSPFVADSETIDVTEKIASFFVSAGLDQANYEVTIKVTTSGGQIREDVILFAVREN